MKIECLLKNILVIITLFFFINSFDNFSVFAENDTFKLGPPASNMSIQEVNAGENSQWSSILILGITCGVIVVIILVYIIKTRKRKTIK